MNLKVQSRPIVLLVKASNFWIGSTLHLLKTLHLVALLSQMATMVLICLSLSKVIIKFEGNKYICETFINNLLMVSVHAR
jgi:hypothetical protein